MRELAARLGMTVIVAAGLLAAAAVITSARLLDPTFHLALYLLANVVFLVDFLDFAVRYAYHRRTCPVSGRRVFGGWMAAVPSSVPLPESGLPASRKRCHVKPYALLVSIFNAEEEIDDFVEIMEPFRERLWIIDDGSTDGTRMRLIHAGYRCLEGGVNRKKPGALRKLLGTLPREIETVLLLDPDTALVDGPDPVATLEAVLFDFQRSGMASFCPRFAVREDGFLSRFQDLEYTVACSFGRKALADHGTNAGVSIYRREALEAALGQHSLSVYAEDLEISLILLGAGERIYYDERLVLETDAKRTWRALFSQRVGWSYGLIRAYARRFGDVRRVARRRLMAGYHYLVYVCGFQILLHPLRLAAVALLAASLANGLDELLGLGTVPDVRFTAPAYFVSVYVKYTALVLAMLWVAVPRGERRDLVATAPFFLFYQVFQIAAFTVGYANFFSLRFLGRRVFRDHYQDEESLVREVRGSA